MRLKDKAAVVTGGGSGIGRGIALAYAREGARVVIADVNVGAGQATAAEIQKAGGEAIALCTDVSVPAQVEAMIAATCQAFGRIDILVNVAGIIQPASLLDTTVQQWDRTMEVNLRGTFLCLQAAARLMVEQGSGKIINTTSILGSNARPQRGAYCASKAGIILLTQVAALEFGPRGVHVNAIAPGSIETPLVLSAPAEPAMQARKIAAIALRRRGDPDDLTGPAIFLASSESDYMTGTVITVDGGLTAGME